MKKGYNVVVDRDGLKVWIPFNNKRAFSRAKHNHEFYGKVVQRRVSIDDAIRMCQENNFYSLIFEINGFYSWTCYKNKIEFNKEKDKLEGRVVAQGILPEKAVELCRNYNSRNGN